MSRYNGELYISTINNGFIDIYVFFTSQVAVWDVFHQKHVLVIQLFCRIGSMYGLFTITYICLIFMANVYR